MIYSKRKCVEREWRDTPPVDLLLACGRRDIYETKPAAIRLRMCDQYVPPDVPGFAPAWNLVGGKFVSPLENGRGFRPLARMLLV